MCESNKDSNIIVRSTDTDVLIILLTHKHALQANIWMDVGVSSNNTRRYIDVAKLADELGPDICNALAGYHAFTGCDYTASFFRKGKVRPLAIMEKDDKFIEVFAKLGESADLQPDLLTTIESFVCCMYGNRKVCLVNEARYKLFQQRYAPKNQSQPLDKIKGLMQVTCHHVALLCYRKSNGQTLLLPCEKMQ